MEQRDLIKDQIEQFARAIRHALQRLISSADGNDLSIVMDELQQTLKENEHLDDDLIDHLSAGNFSALPDWFWSKENVLLSVQLLEKINQRENAIQLIDHYFAKSNSIDLELMELKQRLS